MCAEMAHVLRRERFNSQESEETQTAVHDRRVLRAGRGQHLRFHALRVSCAHTVAQQADALYLSHSAMQAEAGVDANLGCNADVRDMYTDDPLTMLCGAIATMRLALVIPALHSSGSQIGESRMEAGRVGPKRGFSTRGRLSIA